MKKLILFFIVVFSFVLTKDATASHVAGGEISYRYIGDSTNIPFDYEVTVMIYRDNDPGNATLGGTQNIVAKSSCFPDVTATFNRIPGDIDDGGWYISSLNQCADESIIDSARFTMHLYKGTITLPGACADWTFEVAAPCCRNNAITNLQGASGAAMYIVAKLNNTKGENSSPVFTEPAAKVFCVGKTFSWNQGGIEPDGDSLYYDFGHPLNAGPALDDSIPFAPGYSWRQPMITVNGISVDHKYGFFNFTTSQPDFNVIKVVIQEYRYDSTLFQWFLTGEVMRELQIPIVSDCRPETQDGPKIDTTAAGFSDTTVAESALFGYGLDSIGNPQSSRAFNPNTNEYDYTIPVIDGYNCYDSLLMLVFDEFNRVQCNSFDPTDFRLLGPDTVPRPIVSISGGKDCIRGTDADTIYLSLEKPLDVNGSYLFYTKRGVDNTTLTNLCGFNVNPFFTMFVRVKNCPPLIYNVENVTVVEDEDIRIDWDIDPNYFARGAYKVFTGWQVIKRLKGTQEFYGTTGGLIRDINARSYLDTTVNDYQVDRAQFEYGVQLFQNGYDMPPTGIVSSILLTDTNKSNSILELNWTEYIAWDSAVYQVYVGKYDTINQWADWQPEGPANTNYYSYDYTLPPADSVNSNLYYVKVEATSKDPFNPFVAESNWIYFGVIPPDPEPEPPVVGEFTIPNVITPNGDNVNDRFYISSEGKPYETVQVAVYNRWGQVVFEDNNFSSRNDAGLGWDGTDMNSGQKLADGVYYYIIKMDDPTAESDQKLQGSVTILSGGSN